MDECESQRRESSGLGLDRFDRLREFIRAQGTVRTTLASTFFAIGLSVALSELIRVVTAQTFDARDLSSVILAPVIIVPVLAFAFFRLFLRLDQAEERYRREAKERRVTEEALRDNEARFRALFEHSSDMILLLDFQGRIVGANPKSSEMLGWDEEVLTGSSIEGLCVSGAVVEKLDRLTDGDQRFETVLWTQYGRDLEVEIFARVVDPDKEIIQAIIHDVTAHKETERALRLAKEASEEASRVKSRFVANVSHEIRTPLHGIIGLAELILMQQDVESAKSYARKLLDSANTLMPLVSDLLDQAKLEAGRILLSPRPVDLCELASRAVTAATSRRRSEVLDIDWSLVDGTPRYVIVDPLRLQQVLVNLLVNAVKFTEQGKVELTIARIEDEESQQRLFFAVDDTGPGIPKKVQNAIFESFVQVDASTTREYSGTGLGTAIARELVELMKGEIGLFSVPGSGSTFWFTIPLEEAPRPSAGTPPPLVDGRSSLQGTLLLVEDSPIAQEIVRYHLESGGHEVQVADDGEAALRLCTETLFDLIFMDIQMPKIDGLEATRLIRAETLNRETPVVALTASGEAETRESCMAHGMNDVLIKPLRRNELLDRVGLWLLRFQRGRPPDGSTERLASPAPKAPADEDIPFDHAKALAQFGDNHPLMESIVTRFLDKTASDLLDFRALFQEGEEEDLRSEAHKLKGAAAFLTAEPLARSAASLEMKLATSGLPSAAAELAQLEQEFHRFGAFLRDQWSIVAESEPTGRDDQSG